MLAPLSERMIAWLKETRMNLDKIPAAALQFKAEMRVEGKREALLVVLGSRRLSLTAEERAAIDTSTDSARIDRWLAKAATARSAGEVLELEKKAPAKPSPANGRARTAKRRATRA